MSLLNRRRPSIGLDIGSSGIKLMELDQDSKTGRYRLLHFEMATLPPEAIVDGQIMNTTVVVDQIRELLQRRRIKTKFATASISGNSVIIKRVTLPQMSIDELEEFSPSYLKERFARLGTIDLRVDYLRPGRGTEFIATAHIIRAGSKVAVARMELHNEEGTHIAFGTGTYLVG